MAEVNPKNEPNTYDKKLTEPFAMSSAGYASGNGSVSALALI